jgi:hypothetical protein
LRLSGSFDSIESNKSEGGKAMQRAVTLQVLSSEVWTRVELEQAIGSPVSDALAMLAQAGVVVVQGDRLRASLCARHLDTLGLIAL